MIGVRWMGKFIDMTGWVMKEHGVPESGLTVVSRAENTDDGRIQWLCSCSCESNKQVVTTGENIRNGHTLSCGCIQKEKQYKSHKKQNKYEIVGDTVHIYLNKSSKFTTIDLDKWNTTPYIKDLCWYLSGNGYIYAHIPKNIRNEFNNKKSIGLHQLICPCEDGFEPDHIDRNRLNNVSSNLVVKTRSENLQNKGLAYNNQSGVTGVCWSNRLNKWRAYITVKRKHINLGTFVNKDDAIRARKNAETKYFWQDRGEQ